MGFFDLGRVQNVIQEAMGLEVTHAYDDLVFVEHSAVLIQFDRSDLKAFHCHFNQDCAEANRGTLFERIQSAATHNGLSALKGRVFALEQIPDQEEIRIRFL